MVKYAIFFGAGASLGSGCNQPERPPSGDELFKKLCKFNPKLWEKYSDLFENVHFETGWHCLKEKCILNKNDLFMYELHQDLGRFFFKI